MVTETKKFDSTNTKTVSGDKERQITNKIYREEQ
jgi:hypothetical protein